MLRFLARKKAAPRAPDGQVIYAIGDIHGRADLLRAMLGAIADRFASPGRQATIVGLGDYIDRGPDSKGVIDLLISVSKAPGLDVRWLLGNHEQTMLDFLDDPACGPAWADFGGRAALASYGVAAPTGSDKVGWAVARAELREALPSPHLAFLKALELTYEAGDYFFAHAGVRPGVPLDRQSPEDLTRIRQAFIEDRRPLPKVVVHGHSPHPEAHVDHRRIGIDTGAYATGALTVLRLEGTARMLIQTQRRPDGGVAIVERAV